MAGSDDGFDPIEDENKPFDVEEWATEAKKAIDDYVAAFGGPVEARNEYHKKPHTWREWFASFHGYMSW